MQQPPLEPAAAFAALRLRRAKEAGPYDQWRFEGATPNLLYRRGITPAVLKPGVNLTIKAHPHRTENAGEMTEVVSADGKTLHLGLR